MFIHDIINNNNNDNYTNNNSHKNNLKHMIIMYINKYSYDKFYEF